MYINHSNESYQTVLSSRQVLCIKLYRVVLSFGSVAEILQCDHSKFQIKAIKDYVPVILFIMLYKMVLTFESVDQILKCDHSNESY